MSPYHASVLEVIRAVPHISPECWCRHHPTAVHLTARMNREDEGPVVSSAVPFALHTRFLGTASGCLCLLFLSRSTLRLRFLPSTSLLPAPCRSLLAWCGHLRSLHQYISVLGTRNKHLTSLEGSSPASAPFLPETFPFFPSVLSLCSYT